jgi:hypothetical protein
MTALTRAWINQPSKLQPFHRLHGTNVLAEAELDSQGFVRVWFLGGSTISQIFPLSSLSPGWLKSLDGGE